MSNDPQHQEEDRYKPDWAYRAEQNPHKPNWIDGVPHVLWELGEVFFPIPNKQKAWPYPHYLDTKRFGPDNEILNAYLESNANYGIACANDLAVVDIDEIDYVDHIKSQLPDTVWQMTGSRTGEHLFFMCPGLNTRIILRVPLPQHHMTAEGIENISGAKSQHIGEVKCDPHGYVVGPGSTHPSGNQYGPLKGDEIATIKEEEMYDALSQYVNDSATSAGQVKVERRDAERHDGSKYKFYNLTRDDVVPWLEEDARVPHPVHGSSTGSNFMKPSGQEVFMCWRHNYNGTEGCALNPQHLLAVMATNMECDEVRRYWDDDPTLHYRAWLEATKRGIVSCNKVPYTVAKGCAIALDRVGGNEELTHDMYWDAVNAARCIAQKRHLPDRSPE